MTAQPPAQLSSQHQAIKKKGIFPRWLLILLIFAVVLACLFFIGATIFWIWNVWGNLSNTLGAIFTALGTIFGFIALVITIPPFFQYLKDRRSTSSTPTTPAPSSNQDASTQPPFKSTEPLISIRESASNKKAVVFIPGIGAKDPEKYWQQFTSVLLQDTSAFIKDFDIYAWGYPTHKGPKRLINFILFLITRKPANAAPEIWHLGGLWRSTYKARFKKYQDTVLVCHSMGGLVIKSYIVDVLADGKSNELDSVRHITFYGTPHSGAPSAGVAWNDQLKGMTIMSEFVERIRESWYDHVVKWKDVQIGPRDDSYNRYIPHMVLASTIDTVVPFNFAIISGMLYERIHGDHSTIIQPADTNDTRYRFWWNEMEQIFASGTGNEDDQKALNPTYAGEIIVNQPPSLPDQPSPQNQRSINLPPIKPPPSTTPDRPNTYFSPTGNRNVLDTKLYREIVQKLEGIPATSTLEGRNGLLSGIPRRIIASLNRDRNNDGNDLALLLTQLDGLGPLTTGEQPLIIFMQNAQNSVEGLIVSRELDTVLEELKHRYEGASQQVPEATVISPGSINTPGNTGKSDIIRPSDNAPFPVWAKYYIKNAKKEITNAHTSFTVAGLISSEEYKKQSNSLDVTKKSFEEFLRLIDRTPKLPSEITLGQEMLRLKVNTSIEYLEQVKSCIAVPYSLCHDIKQKFKVLLDSIDDLGRQCKIDN